MGIFTFDKSNREQELQNEIDSRDIQIVQNQMQIKKLEIQLKEQEEEQLKDENAIKRLAVERDELARTNAELEVEKTSLYYELEEIKEEKEKEKNLFEKIIESLKEKLSKKDANLKDEQRKKGKYKFLITKLDL